jgi:hypothetical protein
MALPVSGPISLSDIQTEFGGTNPISMNEYYANGAFVPAGAVGHPSGVITSVPSSGAIDFRNLYYAGPASVGTTGVDQNLVTGFGRSATFGNNFFKHKVINSTWIGITNQGFLTSTDGITFTKIISSTAASFSDIGYYNGTWYGLTNSFTYYTSTSLAGPWTSNTITAPANASYTFSRFIRYVPSLGFIIQQYNNANPRAGVTCWSQDLVSFTTNLSVPVLANFSAPSIPISTTGSVINGYYCWSYGYDYIGYQAYGQAMGSFSVSISSIAGQQSSQAVGNGYMVIAFGVSDAGGRNVVRAYYSTNGTSWSVATIASSVNYSVTVAFVNGFFYAYIRNSGVTTTSIYQASNPNSWTLVATNPSFSATTSGIAVNLVSPGGSYNSETLNSRIIIPGDGSGNGTYSEYAVSTSANSYALTGYTIKDDSPTPSTLTAFPIKNDPDLGIVYDISQLTTSDYNTATANLFYSPGGVVGAWYNSSDSKYYIISGGSLYSSPNKSAWALVSNANTLPSVQYWSLVYQSGNTIILNVYATSFSSTTVIAYSNNNGVSFTLITPAQLGTTITGLYLGVTSTPSSQYVPTVTYHDSKYYIWSYRNNTTGCMFYTTDFSTYTVTTDPPVYPRATVNLSNFKPSLISFSGKLIMWGVTSLSRPVIYISADNGVSWNNVTPSDLAAGTSSAGKLIVQKNMLVLICNSSISATTQMYYSYDGYSWIFLKNLAIAYPTSQINSASSIGLAGIVIPKSGGVVTILS